MWTRTVFLLLLALLASSVVVTRADDDLMEEEDGVVESDELGTTEEDDIDLGPTDRRVEEEEEGQPRVSPDADVKVLAVEPSDGTFPANSLIRMLVGMTNKGDKTMRVHGAQAFFVHPQDYSYFMYNHTATGYHTDIAAGHEATFQYMFFIHESFHSRPMGLLMVLDYEDGDKRQFNHALFNETINITEQNENFDGETFFLYIMLVALVLLLAIGVKQLLAGKSSSSANRSQKQVETGTTNSGYDPDWIPAIHKSPGSDKSPRKRRGQRSPAGVEE